MAQQGFDISKYITSQDIAAAVTAGIIAYIRNRPKLDDQKQPQPDANAPQGQQPQAAQPRGQAPATQPQTQPQAPAVPKKEPGWMKYCDDPSDPNEVAAARLQYKAEQLSNATGGAPSATGTFQGGQLTSAAATAAPAPSLPPLGNGNFKVPNLNFAGKPLSMLGKFGPVTSKSYLNSVGSYLSQAGVRGADIVDCQNGVSNLLGSTVGQKISPGVFNACINHLGPAQLKALSDGTAKQCNDILMQAVAKVTGNPVGVFS